MGSKEKDHEVSMAKSQVRNSITNLKRVQKVLSTMSDDDNLPAWVQAKITDTEHNTDATAGYMDEDSCPICYEDPCQCLEGTVTEGKRDGKSAKDKNYSLRDWFKGGGWVQTGGKYDGKPCAKQPGQKTKPYCRDADDRASMSKKERNKRARKKRKEDPNPNRKGKAKNVRQESYSNWREEIQLAERDAWGTGPMDRIKCADGVCRTPAEIEKLRLEKLKGKVVDKAHFEPEGENIGEGHPEPKVNYLKDMDPYDRRRGIHQHAPGTPLPTPVPGLPDMRLKRAKAKTDKKVQTAGYQPEGELVDEQQGAPYKDLKGFTPRAFKDMKQYPAVYKGQKGMLSGDEGAKGRSFRNDPKDYDRAVKQIELNKRKSTSGRGAGRAAFTQNNSYKPEGEMVDEGKKDACYKKVKASAKVWPSAYASGRLVQCRKKGAANYGKSKKNEEYDTSNWKDDFQPLNVETVNIIEPEPIKGGQKIDEKCWDGYTQKGMKKKGKRLVPNCVKEKYSNWREELFEPEGEIIEDWQKSNRKDGVDGMSQKSVDAYKRENPGSKLKTAVTGKVKKGSKDAKRRKSFCARSDGQRKMHNIDCSKTPDKKICKARKRWKC